MLYHFNIMKEKDILKNNRLIAEFMGWVCKPRKSYNDNRKVLYTDKGKIFKYNKSAYLFNKDPWTAPLKFHSSWDWLMPVVEKIESLEINKLYTVVDIAIYQCSIYHKKLKEVKFFNFKDSKIEAVYQTVVEFIEWYNKNKQTVVQKITK